MPLYSISLYGISFVLTLVMGSLVLAKDYKSSINLSFFAFTLSITAWIIGMFLGYMNVPTHLGSALVFFRFAYGVSVFPVFTLCLFFYYFPKKSLSIPKNLGYILTILTFIIAFVGIFTPLIEESLYMNGAVATDIFGPLYGVYLFYCVGFIITAVVLAVKKILNSSGLEKKKIIYVASGFFASVLLATMTNVILPIFGIVNLQNESVAFSIVFFISVFYSLYRQRFFNLSYIALHFLRSFLLLLYFLGIFFISSSLLNRFAQETDSSLTIILSSILAFFALRTLEKFFPDFYSGAFLHFKKTIAEFDARVFDCKTYSEFKDLLQMTFEERLNIKNVNVFLIEKKEIEDDIPVYLEDHFTKYLRDIKSVLVADELVDRKIDKKVKAILIKKMDGLEAKLCFPLFSEDKLIGIFILGKKKDAYTREEIEEILKIRPSIQTCFMNIFITNTLREENDIMKKIISERTETLKKTNEKLGKIIQQQDSFISLTAHEFRTPLTVAMLGLEQISYLHKKRIPQEVINDVETSYNQLNNLTNLINRLLEMRRVEDGKIPITLEEVELVGFLKEIVRGMGLIANTENVEIIFKPPKQKKILAITDKVKLRQVVDNLLQNAIKFTRKDRSIHIKLRTDPDKKWVRISVEDRGIGIPEKDLEVIFEKFQQGSRYNKGIGIGLYLCKQYMQLLQGKITVQSKEGKGSTFTIEFPFNN